MKHRDEHAQASQDILGEDRSVLSGLSIDDLKAGQAPVPPPAAAVVPGDIPGARRAALPAHPKPMLAATADAPFSHPDWLFEPKLDGFRTIAIINEGKVRLLSRRGLDVTRQYQHLTEGLRHQPASEMALDGEIIALDEKGRTCFQCLQQYLQTLRRSEEGLEVPQLPVIYYVFDILYLDGYDLTGVALRERKELLAQTLQTAEYIRQIDYFIKDGQTVYEAAVSNGLEGVIAKRQGSVYEAGKRSQDWLKIKSARSDEFIIAGYSQGNGSRARTFGALLLGYYDDRGRLIYAGHVGTGFDDRTLLDLRRRLDSLQTEQCPFDDMPPLNAPTIWVRPELVAEVRFDQWTQEGYLRIPVFLRLREEKVPDEVRLTRMAPVPAAAESSIEDTSTHTESTVAEVLAQLQGGRDEFTLEIEGQKLGLTNLDKELWPAWSDRRPLTKRDLLIYLAQVSPYLLPHLRHRPLTLSRYPGGVQGEHFWQKHWNGPMTDYVARVPLHSEHTGKTQEYLLCNNLATLLWLGQVADIELHTWFSRISPEPDLLEAGASMTAETMLNFPDFIIFDIDPYIYSGKESKGAEPELNREAFSKTVQVARWLKEILDSLSLSALVKTSGRTGLHVYVPIMRQFDYHAVQSAAATVSRFLQQRHSSAITVDWTVTKRTGKIFLDYNQNVRGKTLASVYSPRPSPEAAVSMPLHWDELGKAYPTDFTILTAPQRLSEVGDIWAGIMTEKRDLGKLLTEFGEKNA
jgi:bifunctional non-homologous end joining protein LigD